MSSNNPYFVSAATEDSGNLQQHEKTQAGAAHVIGLRRLYCNRNGVFLMVDVPASNVEQKKAELILNGWLIEDDILV